MIHLSDITAFLLEQGLLGGEATADCADTEITGCCMLSEPADGCITWCKSKDYFSAEALSGHKDIILITAELPDSLPDGVIPLICEHPKAAFFSAVGRFFCGERKTGIAPSAEVETERIGENAAIGRFTYICRDCIIGNNVTIGNNVSIECPTVIGDNVVIGSGTVIGTDGYGYYEDAQGIQQRVPHTGGVVIGSFVDIGANTCIDRGTIGDTIIEDYVKIDNLCHIAHNVHIGKHAMVIALSLLAGSCEIGERAYIAPGALIMNQKTVGSGSLVGMGAVVVKDVPEGKVVAGVPAKVIRDNS